MFRRSAAAKFSISGYLRLRDRLQRRTSQDILSLRGLNQTELTFYLSVNYLVEQRVCVSG